MLIWITTSVPWLVPLLSGLFTLMRRLELNEGVVKSGMLFSWMELCLGEVLELDFWIIKLVNVTNLFSKLTFSSCRMEI